MFDGFLIHSRGKAAAALGEPERGGLSVVSADLRRADEHPDRRRAPVIVVETETDIARRVRPPRGAPARQRPLPPLGGRRAPPTPTAFQVGEYEAALGCPQPINNGQQVFVLRAALRHLDTGRRRWRAPPEADRLEVDESGAVPALVHDDVGNVTGGVRSPVVDAPVDVLSGFADAGAPIVCILMGSTTPLTEEQLADLYTSSRRLPGQVRGRHRRDDRRRLRPRGRPRRDPRRRRAGPPLSQHSVHCRRQREVDTSSLLEADRHGGAATAA